MNYELSKASIIVPSSLVMGIGFIMLAAEMSGTGDGDGSTLLLGAAMFFIPLIPMVIKINQLSTFEQMTYDWYKKEHPEHVKGNRISCFACGNPRIHVRALMNKTYHREHFCTQCGKTLYYSPERS